MPGAPTWCVGGGGGGVGKGWSAEVSSLANKVLSGVDDDVVAGIWRGGTAKRPYRS